MISDARAFILLLPLLSGLVACGGKSNADPDDGVGGTNNGTAGKGTGGKASTGGGTMGGSGGSAGKAECEALADDQPHYVPVQIVNDSSETLYVGADMVTCGEPPLFEVTDAEQRPLSPPGPCRASCEHAIKSGPTSCPAVCFTPGAVALKPGEGLSTEWRGQYLDLVKLPDQCQHADYPTPQCDRAISVQPGTFVFSAKAGTELDCSQTTGTECGECEVSGKGGCITPSALIAGSVRTAEAKVELDGSYGVGSDNGDGDAEGALDAVEIRFRDP
jgi:hypothetical protein